MHKIGPRENIIQARSYLKVVEVPETPSDPASVTDKSSVPPSARASDRISEDALIYPRPTDPDDPEML